MQVRGHRSVAKVGQRRHGRPLIAHHPVIRRNLSIVAFRPDTDTISLPLDFYKSLHVGKTASKEIIRKALDRMLNAAPDIGYSQGTLNSRAILLKTAADTLLDVESRQGYDQMGNKGGYAVDVAPGNLPGALVVLQECGQSDVVIQLGTEWLAGATDAATIRDVAAATALAHCDKAGFALEKDSSIVAPAFDHMETALELLVEYDLTSALQEQIAQTLKDYCPRYSLELLALPLGPEFAQHRAKGMHLLRHVLWEADAGRLQDRDGFLRKARQHLTAEEQVNLYQGTPSGSQITAKERLDGALAAIAVGINTQQPQLVAQAAKTYEQLAHAAKSLGGPGVDLSAERAACALLLGDSAKALALLRLDGSQHETAPNPEVKAYVLSNSPSADDLVPGMYALTQSWVQEAVLNSFRDSTGDSVDLAVWFASPWVQGYAQVSDTARRINLGAAPGALVAAVVAFFNWLKVQLMNAWNAIVASFQRHSQHDPDKSPIKILDRQGAMSRSDSPMQTTEGDRTAAKVALDAPAQELRGSTARSGMASSGRAAASSLDANGARVLQGYRGSAGESTSASEPTPADARRQSHKGGRGHGVKGAGPAAAAAATVAAVDTAAAEGATEPSDRFDRTSLEMEGVTVGDLKKRLGQVLTPGKVPQRQHAAAEAALDADTPARNPRVTEDSDMFSAESYETKRASLQALEVAMWDSEPDSSLIARLQRAPKPLLLFAAAVLALGASRVLSRMTHPAPAPPVTTSAASSSNADSAVGSVLKKATVTTADASVALSATPTEAATTTSATVAAAAPQGVMAIAGSVASAPTVARSSLSAAVAGLPSGGTIALADSTGQKANKVYPTAPISTAEADEVVKRWLDTRAAALGPEHQKEQLYRVLQGKMLRDWKQRAQAAQEDGRHYGFKVIQAEVAKLGPWELQGTWGRMKRAMRCKGAELMVQMKDEVSMLADKAAADGGGVSSSASQQARQFVLRMRLQKARWLPRTEWRIAEMEEMVKGPDGMWTVRGRK